jgi:hypothetical protein
MNVAFCHYSGIVVGKTAREHLFESQSGFSIVEGHSHIECAGFIRGVQSPFLGDTAPPKGNNTYSNG